MDAALPVIKATPASRPTPRPRSAAVAEPARCSIAMGRRHTREFQRRWADRYPDVELNLIRTNSPTGGLAEGLCDIAVLRTAVDAKRFARRPAADEGYPRHR